MRNNPHQLPTLLRTFGRIISKTRHPLLICSSVRTALSFFSCFFSVMKHDLLFHWSSNLLLNDPQHLCSTWKASCHDGIIYIPVETKSSEHEFPTLRIMGSQNWWFGDPKEPYVIAESNPFIGRVLHDSWGSENGSISSFNMNQHLNPRKRTNDNGKSPPSLNRKYIFNLVDFP